MTQVHEVPDGWNPDHRCCLECDNTAPDVTLRALIHPATNQQALACTRHLSAVAAVLDSFASATHTVPEQGPQSATTPTAPAARHRSRA
ncbi:hypothetical protein ACIRL3_25345 [Streptomyces sp. NPDC102384]|uniref:hypothetical protein n=1 Tax=Streptomyces sp. NPDC102384 TaxID=3366166 RepID=UPI00381FC35A